MLTITLLLLLAAFVALFAHWIWGKPSLSIAVFCLLMIELLRSVPR